MDRSDIITLIRKTYEIDAIGQHVCTEEREEVFCEVRSVGQREWFEAGRNGLKAELQVNMFGFDYHGEEICEFDGVRYGIYRTYRRDKDSIELYLERKAGV
jgi:hypothetical protein